jgi:PUCC protein.
MAFSMQDVLLEPYGGQVLHLSVGATTRLTAVLAIGGLIGFVVAAHRLGRGTDPYRFAAVGAVVGVAAFTAVIFAAPLDSTRLFALGVGLIGFGSGIFAHCTLTAAMGSAQAGQTGLVLGIWGAVQASAAGLAVAAGGLLRDGVSALAVNGTLGPGMALNSVGYSFVYHCEIALLFATLIALGPLVRVVPKTTHPKIRIGRSSRPGLIRGGFHGPSIRQLHRRRPGRALRILDLLRRADLLPSPREQAGGVPARDGAGAGLADHRARFPRRAKQEGLPQP